MAWTKCKLELTGVAPLLMHRLIPEVLTKNEEIMAGLPDPEPSKKHSPEWEEWAWREWRRTSYWKEGTDNQPGYLYIPGSAIEGTIRDAGKGDKINKVTAWKVIQSAFYCDGLEFPLITDTVIESLDDVEEAGWVVTHAVRIQSARIPRRRICVPVPWKCTIKCMVETNVVPKGKFESLVERAGDLVGILDWRPKYGRFKVKVVW